MEKRLEYPANYAVLTSEEMTYTDGGVSAGGVVTTVATVIGLGVLASTYVWGVQQSRAWLQNSSNRSGNLFTILGRATDDLIADMKVSPSNMLRDAVSAATMVALLPVTALLLIIK